MVTLACSALELGVWIYIAIQQICCRLPLSPYHCLLMLAVSLPGHQNAAEASAAIHQICCRHQGLPWAVLRRSVEGQRQTACRGKVDASCGSKARRVETQLLAVAKAKEVPLATYDTYRQVTNLWEAHLPQARRVLYLAGESPAQCIHHTGSPAAVRRPFFVVPRTSNAKSMVVCLRWVAVLAAAACTEDTKVGPIASDNHCWGPEVGMGISGGAHL